MSDITKAWAGIGQIKADMTGLERKMTAYRSTQQNHNILFDGTGISNRNVVVDNVPRTIIENRKSSSPLKYAQSDIVFSDIDSVSTIPSRTNVILKDPKALEEGMIKLKEKILKQKQSRSQSYQRISHPITNDSETKGVRFLDPVDYSSGANRVDRSIIPTKDIRKRKIATAPEIAHYPGLNEAQKPTRKQQQVRHQAPESVRNMQQPAQIHRKVAPATSKNALITTSSWRQGAALTRKVLGNKTQDTSSSTISDTKSTGDLSSKSSKVSPPKIIKKIQNPTTNIKSAHKTVERSSSPPKRTTTFKPRKPKPPSHPSVSELSKPKPRHYNPNEVQKYIENSKKQRKKQLADERKKKAEAEKEKEKRLQNLFNFQKKALKRSTNPPSPSPPKRKFSSDSEHKKNISSESDKENSLTLTDTKIVQNIPLIPPQTSKMFAHSPPTKEFEIVSEEEDEEEEDGTIVSEKKDSFLAANPYLDDNPTKSGVLLETYMDAKNDTVTRSNQIYSEQRQRMEAIRQTALALRQKIHEETNRLTVEASKVNNLSTPLAAYNKLASSSNQGEIKEAWSDNRSKEGVQLSDKTGRSEFSESDKTLTESRNSSMDATSPFNYRDILGECPYNSPPKRDPSPDPYQFPLEADPYSVINVYARKRQLEQERMKEEQLRRDIEEETQKQKLETELLRVQRERREEQERLRELELELQRDKQRMLELKEHKHSAASQQVTAQCSATSQHPTTYDETDEASADSEHLDTRDTESLLHTSNSDFSQSHGNSYDFTPDKTGDFSMVSAASTKKTLSFSETESPGYVSVDKSGVETGMYSPAALHRKLRGELARYDTYSMGLEHVNTLQHTQQHTDAQYDTIAVAKAMKRSDAEHTTEMSDLQEKLKADMLAFQEKLNQVQAQTVLEKAESLTKQAEAKAKSAEAALDATNRIADSHEQANRQLINMAQHILQSHSRKPDETPTRSDYTSRPDSSPYTESTPYTPSKSTPQLSKTTDSNVTSKSDSEAVSPTDRTPTVLTEIDGDEVSDPVPEEIVEEENASPFSSPIKHDISTDIPDTPCTDAPDTPYTDIPDTPFADNEIDTEIETEFEASPEKVHESFRAVLPSEAHRRRMSVSEDQESVASVAVSRKDSFTAFTMEQVNEYVKNEAMRAKHQEALLDLRKKALKEKTEAKLQWIDIKKKRIQRKGEDDKMPPLLQKEKDILAKLSAEQDEINRLHAVQKAAQAERKKMLQQQRDIKIIQHRTSTLRRKIKYAEDNLTDDLVSDTDVSEAYKPYSEYDTDVSSIYGTVDDTQIKSLTDFNKKVQEEGREVKRILDLALKEKRETEQLEQEFGISSPSRLPRGIRPITDSSSTASTIKETSPKYTSAFESASTPLKDGTLSVPESPAMSVIDGEQSSYEVREMESRIRALKNELSRKKCEARSLLKDQRQRKKETLKLQEQKLRKQIQTVTDVIEKQKKQIHPKLRQHSPSRTSEQESPRRSQLRSISPDRRSQLRSVSPDSSSISRVISVTSSISESVDRSSKSFLEKSTPKSSNQKSSSGSISEEISKTTPVQLVEALSSASDGTSDKPPQKYDQIKDDTISETSISEQKVSDHKKSQPYSDQISENISISETSVSEDLSKYSEASYHKLPGQTVTSNISLAINLSLPELLPNVPSKPDLSEIDNLKSIDDLQLSFADESKSSTTPSKSSQKQAIYSLQDVGSLSEQKQNKEPFPESPQPSLHLSVNDVLEDLSISSGSSLNETSGLSLGITSFKELPSFDHAKPEVENDDDHDSISEEISEAIASEQSSNISRRLASARELDLEIEKSLRSDRSSSQKSISEKLADLKLDDDNISPKFSRLTSKSSMKSYTLSFETSDNEPDGAEEEIKSLLSNIDVSLNKSAEIMSAAKSAPYLGDEVDEITPAIDIQTTSNQTTPRSNKRNKSSDSERESEKDTTTERGHTFSNLTAISSTTSDSTGTGETTIHSEQIKEQRASVTPSFIPSPPKSEKSHNLRHITYKSPSATPLSEQISEEISEQIEAGTEHDVDDISLNERDNISFSNDQHADGDSSLSASKTMSELKDLMTDKSACLKSSSDGSVTPVQDKEDPLKQLLSPRSDVTIQPNEEQKSLSNNSTDKTVSHKSSSQKSSGSHKTSDSQKTENSFKTSDFHKTASEHDCSPSKFEHPTVSESYKSEAEKVLTKSENVESENVLTKSEKVLTKPEDTSDELTQQLLQTMLRSAFDKMMKVRQNKLQKELNSSPKYMERSPTSPEQLSPTRGEPAIFNDTFRDNDLENALSLARSCTTPDDDRAVMTPEVPPPPKITVQNTHSATHKLALEGTRHLVACIRSKRPCTLDTFSVQLEIPEDLDSAEEDDARTYHQLVLKTTAECFEEVNREYNLCRLQKEALPPWRPEIKRRPRPHWMKNLPHRVTTDNVEEHLPDAVVRILGLSDTCEPRKYHHMESILAQEVRDEEAEWTDYDADELAVKFRLADSIFDNLIRETIAVFSAIDQDVES